MTTAERAVRDDLVSHGAVVKLIKYGRDRYLRADWPGRRRKPWIIAVTDEIPKRRKP